MRFTMLPIDDSEMADMESTYTENLLMGDRAGAPDHVVQQANCLVK